MAVKKTAAKAQTQTSAEPARLVIDDGSRRVPIVNQFGDEVGEFYLIPTDLGIYERFNGMSDEVEQIMAPLFGMKEAPKNLDEFTKATEDIKARLFAVLDKMLGYDGAAARMFGKRHPLSPHGGRFYFQAVFELLGKEINAAFERETEMFSENVKKYTQAVKK